MMPRNSQIQRTETVLRTGLLAMKKSLVILLAGSLFLPSLQMGVMAQALQPTKAKPVQGQVSISREVTISPSVEKVSLNLRDANIRDILNMLAAQGKFNLILDESVEGTLTIDIKDIPINKALEYIFTVGQLSYTKDGNTVIVAAQETANERNMTAKTFKAIPVQYKNAFNVATQLNNTILKVQRPGGSTSAVVDADLDSNSLLVMGTDSDIRLIGDALRELDVPRNRKVYHIKHNTPSYVAQVLAANFFMSNSQNNNGGGGNNGGMNGGTNGGSNGGMSGGGNTGGGMSGGGNTGGGMSGGSNGGMSGGGNTGGGMSGGTSGGMSGGGNAGGGMSGGGTTGGGASGGTTGGTHAGLNTFSMGGVTFIAEPISATLTVLGTDEQLSLIDSVLEQVDVRRPQVAIEVSLVEIQDSTLKNLIPSWTSFNFGRIARLQPLNGGVNVLDLASPFTKQKLMLPRPETVTSQVSLSFQNQNIRGKILANPTIVTMDGTSANISITDQVPTISQTNTVVNGVSTITTTISTQEAGVTLDLTPQIFNDGAVLLNLQPNVSQPVRTVTATSGSGATLTTSSTVLLATRSMNLSGVRVQDGETLVIGGLLRETAQTDISKTPGLASLPIVSAMFRSTNRNDKDKTELVLMVTPHILKEEAISYFDHKPTAAQKPMNLNQGYGGIQPVSLPKFIGPTSSENAPSTDTQLTPATHNGPSPSSSEKKPVTGLPQVGQTLKSPQKQMMEMASPVIQTDAIKTGQPNQKAVTPPDRVYQKPTPKLQLPDLMDEILKN